MKILEEIRHISKLEELENFIESIVTNNIDERYIQAIINEGHYTVESGEDFYLKLVLAHQKIRYKKTWLKSNLSFGLSDPDFGFDEEKSIYDLFIENVITLRKVKGSKLYQLNPNIVTDSIEEYEYDNNVFVNAYFNDEYSIGKGKPVIKTTDNKNFLLIKDVLFPFLNNPEDNNYPKYKLIAEYEYRTHNNQCDGIATGIHHTNKGVHDIYKGEGSLQILGSIDICLKKDNLKPQVRNIKVIDLSTGKIKKHNPRNFDDDLNAGFVIFKKEILNILVQDYYFFDLIMIDKTEVDNSYLIDVLSDKVVFWEGEYNKLPQKIKNMIDKFNFVPTKIKNIISPGMKAWQLDADWHYDKKLYPEQLLAWKVRQNYFNQAIEIGINFLIPNSILEFREFISKIEEITKIKLTSFNNNQKDVQLLVKISNGEEVVIDKENLELLFRKYCYQMSLVIDHE